MLYFQNFGALVSGHLASVYGDGQLGYVSLVFDVHIDVLNDCAHTIIQDHAIQFFDLLEQVVGIIPAMLKIYRAHHDDNISIGLL